MYVATVEQFLWRSNPHPVWVTRAVFRLDCLDLRISVSPKMNRSSGFVRLGSGEPYLETWDGRRVTDPNGLRCYCRYFDEHYELIAQRVRRRMVSLISAGNYPPNLEYVLLLNDEENREPRLGPLPVLYRRRDEDERIRAGRDYYALLVWQDGHFSPERVKFLIGAGNQGRVRRLDDEDVTDRVCYVLTSPPLVWEGEPLSLLEMAPRWACDFRHVVGAVKVDLPDGGWMNLGEAELASEVRLRDAAAGDIVDIPLNWKPDPEGDPVPLPSEWAEIVRQACRKAGYEEVSFYSALRQRSQFYLTPDGRTLLMRFREGVYPHNVLGFNPDEGTLINIQVDGMSGRSGCTLVEMAQLLRRAGAKFGWGLDQGADPHLMAGDFLKGSFLERWRVSAALALVLKAEIEKQVAWNEPVVRTPHLTARELREAA